MKSELFFILGFILGTIGLIGRWVYGALKKFWQTKKTATSSPLQLSLQQRQEAFQQTLEALQSEVQWGKTDEEGLLHGSFIYQGGHFLVEIDSQSPFTRLLYLYFQEEELADIDIIREVVNDIAGSRLASRLSYNLKEQEGKIILSIVLPLILHSQDSVKTLRWGMDEIMWLQNAVTKKIISIQAALSHTKELDIEKQSAEISRQVFLMRELEMERQKETFVTPPTQGQPLTLADIVTSALGLVDIVPARLNVYTEEGMRVEDDPDKILALDLAHTLMPNEEQGHQPVSLLLQYYDPQRPKLPQLISVTLNEEGRAEQTLYYRVTLATVPLPAERQTSAEPSLHPSQAFSALLALDKDGAEKQRQEFAYLYKEALAKEQAPAAHSEPLTEDEKLLLALHHQQWGWMVYRGKQLTLQNRYYEALLLLQPVRQMLRQNITESSEQQEVMQQVNYLMGLCHMKLNQWDRACYYLQSTLPNRSPLLLQAYINCIVEMMEPHALPFINSLIDEAQEDEAAHTDFYFFLLRRKATLLRRLKRWDEAETILQEMLQEAKTQDFALKELALIQKLRNAQ